MRFSQVIIAVLASMCCHSAIAATIVDQPNHKAVGAVKWHKQKSVDAKLLAERAVPYGEASLFFVRAPSAEVVQTSVNIAINDRFQVSLQPGNFSQVNSCAGLNDLSAEITGHKSNDLLYQAQRYDLASQAAYFFFVEIDAQGYAKIRPVAHKEALNYIDRNNIQYQTHQISRVVKNNCEQPLAPLPVVTQAPPEMPIAKEPVSIELAVLFDTDKSFVKPSYYEEIGRVAHFMQKHPNTTAVIEGHTDSRADDEYNKALAKRRVDAVKAVLINEYQIDPNRLSTISYGETRPIASNDTAEGRRQNRRVIATFSGYQF